MSGRPGTTISCLCSKRLVVYTNESLLRNTTHRRGHEFSYPRRCTLYGTLLRSMAPGYMTTSRPLPDSFWSPGRSRELNSRHTSTLSMNWFTKRRLISSPASQLLEMILALLSVGGRCVRYTPIPIIASLVVLVLGRIIPDLCIPL